MGFFDQDSPLEFPAGTAPGFNPSHVAGTAVKLSAISATGGNFTNILNGSIGTVTTGTGSPAQLIDSNLGPVSQFKPSALSGNGRVTISGIDATNFTTLTLAVIFKVALISGNQTLMITSSVSTNGARLSITASNFLAFTITGAQTTSAISVAANVPYFVAVSWSGSTLNIAATRLDTGQRFSATGTNSTSPAAPNGSVVLGNNNSSQELGGWIAAAMYSGDFMVMPQLLQWANNPWDFWYPPTVQNLIFNSLSKTLVVADILYPQAML